MNAATDSADGNTRQAPSLRVLIFGGYGVFGRKLCERLLREPGIELIIAGRSRARAEAAVAELDALFPGRKLSSEAIDCTAPLAPPLAQLRPDLVIHAAGPFQERDYHVAEACIAQGCHYIDLADGRAFVSGIVELDAAARAAGVLVVSGASTLPGLSAAVVDHLRQGFAQLDGIAIGITPGNRAPRGRAVVEAILGYAGRPIRVWRDGSWQRSFGWQDLRRRPLPGLGPRWFATCDVPDLDLFPQRFPDLRTMSLQAGLELSILHLGLWALTWPVRWGLIGSLRPLAVPLLRLAKAFEGFGSDRGGMFVEVTGTDESGLPHRCSWTLLAESGDGPVIPVIPAVILAGKLQRDSLTTRGARPCVDLITLDEFRDSVRDLAISLGVVAAS